MSASISIGLISAAVDQAIKATQANPAEPVRILFTGPPGSSKTKQFDDIVANYCDLGVRTALLKFVATQRNQPDLAGFMVPSKRADGKTVTIGTVPDIIEQANILREGVWGRVETEEVDENDDPVMADGWVQEPYERVIVLLDELMSADPLMKKALSSFVSDGEINGHVLPPECYIFATGNRQKDRAGVTASPMQLINRFSVVDVIPDFEGWRSWAVAFGIHPLYITAVEQHEAAFITQEVPNEAEPFCTLRQLVAAHEFHMAGLSDKQRMDSAEVPMDGMTQSIIAGLIGAKAAATLMGHLANWKHLPTRKEMINNPSKCKCPNMENPAATFTASEMVVQAAEVGNMDTLWVFAQRLPDEIVTRTALNVIKKNRRLLQKSPVFQAWASENGELLTEVLS